MHPPPQQGARRSPRGRIDLRLGQHAPAEKHGDVLGVDRVMFGLAAGHRFHLERVAKDKREAFLRTQVGEPVPRKDARHGDHNLLTIGGDRLQKRFRTRLHIAVYHDLAVLAEETDIHGAGMEIKATVNSMLSGVEAHEVSSSA
jgi:hypothetical protein